MNEQEWRRKRDDRSLRYAGRVFEPDCWIALSADPDYVARYDGQVAVLTAANLLGRMSPAVVLDIPSLPVVEPLAQAGYALPDVLLDLLFQVDPFGKFCCRPLNKSDYVIHFGRTGAVNLVHGSGWNVYCGSEPSPLENDQTMNPIGPALAAILAVGEAFHTNLSTPPKRALFNALTWQRNAAESDHTTQLPDEQTLGMLWTVGVGSVGTAVLYFLSLATKSFSSVLFDMDLVKIQNLDRAPLFMEDDVGKGKAVVVKKYLNQIGVDARAEPCALDESELWYGREEGVPDILVSAANERNVRSVIESGFPPIQVYGTTGANNQAAMIRHIPLRDACSLCLFRESNHMPTQCATGHVSVPRGGDSQQVDAALPFLSFAAGAMAAAEILKLCLPGYPFTASQVIWNTRPSLHIVPVERSICENCYCRLRSANVHRGMIEGSRYAGLVPGCGEKIQALA